MHVTHYYALIKIISTTSPINDIMITVATHIPRARALVAASNAFIDTKAWFRGTLTTRTPTQYYQKALIMTRLARTRVN